jgi:hypothetical protein
MGGHTTRGECEFSHAGHALRTGAVLREYVFWLRIVHNISTEATMNGKLIATTLLFLVSTTAVAARVESDEAQSFGTKANSARKIIGAVSNPDDGRCDFGEPRLSQYGRSSTEERIGRAVCNTA